MQMFKRMGPRVILVEHRGSLIGLVTVKDVLRFMMTEYQEDAGVQSHFALDDSLEEAWTYSSSVFDKFSAFFQRILRR